jgi:hypothetical protein
MPTSVSLAKDVVDWILARGFCSLNQGLTEAHPFDFFWRYAVPSDVIDPALWPDELLNSH